MPLLSSRSTILFDFEKCHARLLKLQTIRFLLRIRNPEIAFYAFLITLSLFSKEPTVWHIQYTCIYLGSMCYINILTFVYIIEKTFVAAVLWHFYSPFLREGYGFYVVFFLSRFSQTFYYCYKVACLYFSFSLLNFCRYFASSLNISVAFECFKPAWEHWTVIFIWISSAVEIH